MHPENAYQSRLPAIQRGKVPYLFQPEDAICGKRHARPELAHMPEGVEEADQQEQGPCSCMASPHLPCRAHHPFVQAVVGFAVIPQLMPALMGLSFHAKEQGTAL
jgi:hypothetical protein